MKHPKAERGTILVVILFIASAIAALAALSSSRVVTETRHQQVMEDESLALNEAYAQLQLALNVVNTAGPGRGGPRQDPGHRRPVLPRP
jgi:Tfp pilus assembly protein PilX